MYFPAHAQSIIKTLSVNDPAGIVLDPKGNAYIVETGKNRILEFNNNGKFLMTWGSLGSNNGQFYNPTGMTVAYTKAMSM
jgi:DNA-binding beta-propeller fold protein YncE